jgi:type IV pilus assembly protein PilV
MLETRKKQQGSILLEAMVAMVIFAFGVLALFGMQSVAIKNTSQANYRANAIYLAGQIVSQAQGDINHLADYADVASGKVAPWLVQVQNELPNGDGAVVIDAANSIMTVTVTWQAPGDPIAHQHSVTTYVQY